MFRGKHDNIISELKMQRQQALQSFKETRLVKNEALAEYFFCKFKEGQDVPFSILQNIPVGEALLLPVVYGGAIITTKQFSDRPHEIIYNTKWTAGSTLTLHYHSDCNETIEVLEGDIKIYLRDTSEILKKGDKIEIAAGIPHQVTALHESKLKVSFIKIEL